MRSFKSLCVFGLIAFLNYVLPVLPGVDGKEVDIYFGQEKDLNRCPYSSRDNEVVDIDDDLSDLLDKSHRPTIEIDTEEERRVYGGKPKDVKIVIRTNRDKLSRDRSRFLEDRDEISVCPTRRSKCTRDKDEVDEEVYLKKVIRSKDADRSRRDVEEDDEEEYVPRKSSSSQEISKVVVAEYRPSSKRSLSPKRRSLERSYDEDEKETEDSQEELVEEVIRSSKISRSPSRSSEDLDKERQSQKDRKEKSSPKKQKDSSKQKQQSKNKGKKSGKKGKSGKK